MKHHRRKPEDTKYYQLYVCQISYLRRIYLLRKTNLSINLINLTLISYFSEHRLLYAVQNVVSVHLQLFYTPGVPSGSPYLQYVDLTAISNIQCATVFDLVTSTNLCVATSGGQSPCQASIS